MRNLFLLFSAGHFEFERRRVVCAAVGGDVLLPFHGLQAHPLDQHAGDEEHLRPGHDLAGAAPLAQAEQDQRVVTNIAAVGVEKPLRFEDFRISEDSFVIVDAPASRKNLNL